MIISFIIYFDRRAILSPQYDVFFLTPVEDFRPKPQLCYASRFNSKYNLRSGFWFDDSNKNPKIIYFRVSKKFRFSLPKFWWIFFVGDVIEYTGLSIGSALMGGKAFAETPEGEGEDGALRPMLKRLAKLGINKTDPEALTRAYPVSLALVLIEKCKFLRMFTGNLR